MARKFTHLNPKNTLFLLCDVQEKFRPAMPLFTNLIENTQRLTAAGKILDIPLLVTEQNPEKLGSTVKELDIQHAKSVVGKTRFSMLVPEIQCNMKKLFEHDELCDVVLYGLECHICIEQTSIELFERNINVFVAADCVASRVHQDRDMALERLRSAGCNVTTCESIIYDLLRDKNHPKFGDLRKLLLLKSKDMEINQCNLKSTQTKL